MLSPRALEANGDAYLRGMPRPPRAFSEGLYHIASHASDTRRLFLADDQRKTFLERLALTFERLELRLVAYTLMDTHYHLVLFTPESRVSAALQQLHTWYSRWHNRASGRSAHLFRSHFLAREITSDSHLLTACRYIADNPVAAGLVDHPFSWPWSSACASAGLYEPSVPLDPGPLRAALGDGADWRQRYRSFIEAAGDRRAQLRAAG
jgi:putative transposase